LKVAFWSNSYKKCNVTNNMAAISVASALILPYRIMLLENYLSPNNIGQIFSNNISNEIKESSNYYNDNSCIESIVQKSYDLNYNYENVSCIKEIIVNKLYYLPQGNIINNDLFDYEFNRNIDCLINYANNFADIKFIDTSPESSLSTNTILEESDLIIVNICPEVDELIDFFINYASLISKSIFIINVTDVTKCKNIFKIFQKYGVLENKVVFIPFNEMLMYSNYNGSLIEFILFNLNNCNNSKDILFFKSLKKVVNLIFKSLEQSELSAELGEAI